MSNGENDNANETENTVDSASQKDQANESSTASTGAASANNSATDAAGGALAGVMALKDSNPKVFFGGIGALVLILGFFMFGGSGSTVTPHKQAAIVIGNSYVLKGANITSPDATVRLVAVPGSMAAFDDTEKNDRIGGCKHMPVGTPVKAIQTQDAYGKPNAFVQVEMTEGDCTGQKGWVLAVNIQ